MRQLLCLALLAAATGTASAQDQGAPTPIQTLVAPPMDESPVQIKGGDPVVSAHVTRNASAVAACLPDGQMIKLRIHMVWSAKGQPRTIALYGGRAAFQRCVRKALASPMPIVRRRAGNGSIALTLRGIAAAPVPVPVPVSKPTAVNSCKVDDDCRIHYQLSACVPGDPVAVNKAAAADLVRKTYPVKRIECGMGGPQYDKLRRSVEGRWTARCERSRCEVVDHGPPSTGPGLVD